MTRQMCDTEEKMQKKEQKRKKKKMTRQMVNLFTRGENRKCIAEWVGGGCKHFHINLCSGYLVVSGEQ